MTLQKPISTAEETFEKQALCCALFSQWRALET